MWTLRRCVAGWDRTSKRRCTQAEQLFLGPPYTQAEQQGGKKKKSKKHRYNPY